ncbi:MAG: hypothetical protein JNL22_06875 [Bacteroidales bacterium]|nr:hypothetical protein [Bacteroidales bacterium]
MRPPFTIRANGKILLSGEYLVMKGATALAVPLIAGQQLRVSEQEASRNFSWRAYDPDGLWFEAMLDPDTLGVLQTNQPEVAHRLTGLLLAARSLNNAFGSRLNGLAVETQLEFKRNWGFGSSSTLISLVARWAGVSAWDLHRLVSSGSGYDIACATAVSPVLYRLDGDTPQTTLVGFYPEFADHLYLAYLGKKQHSETEVAKFSQQDNLDFSREISLITEISHALAQTSSLMLFMELLDEHETIMESVLGRKSIKKLMFSDFQGSVKSLGAWGGDFVLAASEYGSDYVQQYFAAKNMNVVLHYNKTAPGVLRKEVFSV